MDKIGGIIDLRKEKWGSPSIQESKFQVKLAQRLPALYLLLLKNWIIG